jgi:Fe-S-cluster containining protein
MASPSPARSVPCTSCGLCCTYVTLDVDAPTTVRQATTLLWYLYHPGISLYVDEGAWMVQLDSRCTFLGPDRRCTIYEQRPPICREFEADSCEVNADELGTAFYEPEPYLAYLAANHKRIHALLRKRFVPPVEALRAPPADPRPLAPFAGRLTELRALRTPRARRSASR